MISPLKIKRLAANTPNQSVRSSKLINPKLSSRDHPKIGKELDRFMFRWLDHPFCCAAWQKGREMHDFSAELRIRADP
jgi:hypothetical protein